MNNPFFSGFADELCKLAWWPFKKKQPEPSAGTGSGTSGDLQQGMKTVKDTAKGTYGGVGSANQKKMDELKREGVFTGK